MKKIINITYKNRVTKAIALCALAALCAASLSACGNDEEEAPIVVGKAEELEEEYVDPTLYYDGLSEDTLELIKAEVSDYLACRMFYGKEPLPKTLFSDDLMETLDSMLMLEAEAYCPLNCDAYLETGECEHLVYEDERYSVPQTDPVTYNGRTYTYENVVLDEISTHIYKTDEDGVYKLIYKYRGPEGEQYVAKITYNANENKITEII